VGERDGRDLTFFFDGVHVHAEAELVVATGYISKIYYSCDLIDVNIKVEESVRGDGGGRMTEGRR
jgi:hypothetical protein